MRSPECSGCGPRSGSPLSNVPLVEPRSSTRAAALADDSRVARRGERVLEADVARRRRGPARALRPGRRSSPRAGPARAPRAAAARRRRRPGASRWTRRAGRWRRRASAGAGAAAARGPAGRCARPTAGTGTGRPGSRTSARPRPVELHAPTPPRRSAWSPSSIRSPAASGPRRATRRPLTSTPLVEPRSSIAQPPPRGRISAWRRETFGVVEHDVAVAAAPDHGAARADDHALAVDQHERAAQVRGHGGSSGSGSPRAR